jgi:SAM-dependent methyltransferase
MNPPDYWSKKYRAEGLIWGRTPTAGVRVFSDFLAEKRTLKLLEVGCGYGRDSVYLAKRGCNVTGVDASEEAIALAQKAWGKQRRVVFTPGKGESLDFPSKAFDAAWSSNLLHLYEEEARQRILQEMGRVLVNDGILGFSVASVKDPKFGEGEKLDEDTFLVQGKLMHFFREGEIVNAMEGFKILKLQEIAEKEHHKNGTTHEHVNWIAVGEKV